MPLYVGAVLLRGQQARVIRLAARDPAELHAALCRVPVTSRLSAHEAALQAISLFHEHPPDLLLAAVPVGSLDGVCGARATLVPGGHWEVPGAAGRDEDDPWTRKRMSSKGGDKAAGQRPAWLSSYLALSTIRKMVTRAPGPGTLGALILYLLSLAIINRGTITQQPPGGMWRSIDLNPLDDLLRLLLHDRQPR